MTATTPTSTSSDHGRPVTLTRQVVGRRTVLSVAGEIDVLTAPEFRTAIEEASADGAMELWIDLTETDFMDSSGLHAISEAHERARALGRRLAVICPGGGVRRMFELTGFDGWLPIFDDRAAAQRHS